MSNEVHFLEVLLLVTKYKYVYFLKCSEVLIISLLDLQMSYKFRE